MESNTEDEEVASIDPLEARAALVLRIEQIQRNLAGLVILKSTDSRRQRIDPLRGEIDSVKSQLEELDSIISYSPSPLPIRESNSSSSPQQLLPSSSADLPPSSAKVSRSDFKLPSNLPEFSSGKDVDDFIASLTNLLIAHNVDESRWTSALLVCYSSSSDAAWVKETLLPLPWSVASLQFIERFRDPLQLHRLQAEFYNLKKHPGESVLVFWNSFRALRSSFTTGWALPNFAVYFVSSTADGLSVTTFLNNSP